MEQTKIMNKRCTKCDNIKPIGNFHKYRKLYQSWCKPCSNKVARKRNKTIRENPLW